MVNTDGGMESINGENGASAAKFEAVEEPVREEPKKLTAEEVMKIENSYLKIENLKLQTERMQSDIAKAVEIRQKLQAELLAFRDSLSAKYGVSLENVSIAPDGTITNTPAQS